MEKLEGERVRATAKGRKRKKGRKREEYIRSEREEGRGKQQSTGQRTTETRDRGKIVAPSAKRTQDKKVKDRTADKRLDYLSLPLHTGH